MFNEDLDDSIEGAIDPGVKQVKNPEGNGDRENDKKADNQFISKPFEARFQNTFF